MRLTFPFEEQSTKIFDPIRRPVADVLFWSTSLKAWLPVKMIVDTAADYTLLPRWLAPKLGIKLHSQCRKFTARGVGGTQTVYVVKKVWKTKLGSWENNITLGFLNDNNIPPLLGRLHFLEKLKVTLENFTTTFEI